MQLPPPPLAAIAAALRAERERAGMSLSELARRANVAKSTLSQLESGTGNPSVETLWSLSVALGIPFSQLIEPPQPRIRIIRRGEGPLLPSDNADFVGGLLSAGPPRTRRDLYVMHLEPGKARHAEAHNPGSIEHIVVGDGLLRTGPGDDLIELAPGDYASFPGDVPHHYEAMRTGTWAIMIMEHR